MINKVKKILMNLPNKCRGVDYIGFPSFDRYTFMYENPFQLEEMRKLLEDFDLHDTWCNQTNTYLGVEIKRQNSCKTNR
jgi:hypothetical protein